MQLRQSALAALISMLACSQSAWSATGAASADQPLSAAYHSGRFPLLAASVPVGVTPLREGFPSSPLATQAQPVANSVATAARLGPPKPVHSQPVNRHLVGPPLVGTDSAWQAYGRVVASAQQVASQIGCGLVRAAGRTAFEAPCESYAVLIVCDQERCQPVHTMPQAK